jgi:serine/threonine-protein phosphatase 6 regulatory ankyrin repeat subunit A/serine/threonine-protein phosphatase 6 regulatory ankyrin repeat subunit B
MHSNVKMVKCLLEYGASKPYHMAVLKREQHNKETVAISKNEDEANITNSNDNNDESLLKNTPLLWASFKKNLRIVWLLLEDGYSPNDIDNLGNNSIHLSAAAGNKRILQCLIDDGGNANAVNIYKNQPIDAATTRDIREILEIAMEKGASMTKNDMSEKHKQNILSVILSYNFINL